MCPEVEVTFQVYPFDYLLIKDMRHLNPFLTLELALNSFGFMN